MMSETLIDTDTLRVVLIHDEVASPPDWDGTAFVFALHQSAYASGLASGVEIVQADFGKGEAAENLRDLIRELLAETHEIHSLVDLLKARGAVSVDWYSGTGWGDPTYLAVTTPELAQSWGLDESKSEDVETILRSATDAITDWRSYCEGDVYGYRLEAKATWLRIDAAEKPSDADKYRDTWEEVDSCWGLYGHQHAENEARHAFAVEALSRGLVGVES